MFPQQRLTSGKREVRSSHMDSITTSASKARPLLGNKLFRRLWAAQFTSIAAVYAVTLAGITLVEELAHSTALNAVTLVSAILPAFLGSLVSGTVVDRLGRVRVLIASIIAWTLAALAFWAASGSLSPTWAILAVFATNTMLALVTQFAMSAEYALLPDYVGPALLLQANTLFQISLVAGEALGAILLGPFLIKTTGIPSVGLAAAVLCLLALALAHSLPRDETSSHQPVREGRDWTALATDLRAGWQVIVRDRVLGLVTIQATVAASLLLILIALLPGLASRSLGIGAENVPFLLLPGGLGFVLGLIVANRWEGWLSRLAWICWGLVALGLGIGLLAAASGTPPLVGLMLTSFMVIGLGLALAIIPARTVLQERPPAEVRGRVISAQLALGNAAAVLPLLLGGSLADQIGIQPVLVLMALVAGAAGLAGTRIAREQSR
jgi:MFS family permease